MHISVNLNIGSARYLPDGPVRIAEARRSVRLFHVPNDAGIAVLDSMVPEFLVTDSMVRRYLEIRPPQFRVTASFDRIIDEIERAYVLGYYFSALAASVVTIERMLNEARIKLHQHAPKIGKLWDKGPTNAWQDNIEALVCWGYLPADVADELSAIYEIRRKYLHSDPIDALEAESRRCVDAAFRVLTEFIGFPERVFRIGSTIECLNPSDPLVQVFYKPAMISNDSSDDG